MSQSSKRVCILVIIHKKKPSPYEKISLAQCESIFRNRDIYFICPENLEVDEYKQLCPSAKFDYIDPSWQKDYGMFNRLKIMPFLYNRYKAYQYVLFYESDAFVFRDDLDIWCEKGYDYIGAPWFENFSNRENEGDFIGVGNGGFSLRKVRTHLKVLNTFSHVQSPWKKSNYESIDIKEKKGQIGKIGTFLLDLTIRNNTHRYFNNYMGHEDQFWGLSVAKKFKWFKVPDYNEAASFAFEMQPHRLYNLNRQQLPFGCHAWWKYDLEFWKPHIEKFGYKIDGLF